MNKPDYDVVVVGGGNAALCAALSAREEGASVVLLERAPEAERGGNSGFAGGGVRFVYDSQEEVYELVPDLSTTEKAKTDFRTYPQERYFDDMFRVTQYRTNPDLAEVMIKNSTQAMRWLKNHGVRFLPRYARQTPDVEGKFHFYSPPTLGVAGEGRGLVNALYESARRMGIELRYRANVRSLLYDDDGVHGVVARIDGKTREIRSSAVVLACGGFESNVEWRSRYLGNGWDLAKVRGTRFNSGDGIRMGLDIGAQPYGNWSGAHAVCWDLNAPAFGDIAVGDGFSKFSYPLGIMVNAEGNRFLDEGADFFHMTYAKYGKAILAQPGQFAWQIFDSKVLDILGPLYRIKQMTKVRADTLEQLADKLEGVNKPQFLRTVAQFNAAVRKDVPFLQSARDGRSTYGLDIQKTNWAQTISRGPFEAYAVTCGVTFTFGGLKITTGAEVVDTEESTIPGLYAAGELVGGIFYFNYPGGSGLVSGTVYGRIAGRNAARARSRGHLGSV